MSVIVCLPVAVTKQFYNAVFHALNSLLVTSPPPIPFTLSPASIITISVTVSIIFPPGVSCPAIPQQPLLLHDELSVPGSVLDIPLTASHHQSSSCLQLGCTREWVGGFETFTRGGQLVAIKTDYLLPHTGNLDGHLLLKRLNE